MRPVQRNSIDYYYLKANEALELVTRDEAESWYFHPCTQILMTMLDGDIVGLQDLWKNGAFTSSSSDATIQRNSKEIGKCEAYEDVLNYIKELRRRDVGENT